MCGMSGVCVVYVSGVFQAFDDKSDLGCGAGGGRDNADVFHLAGLTFLTNANADDSQYHGKALSILITDKNPPDLIPTPLSKTVNGSVSLFEMYTHMHTHINKCLTKLEKKKVTQ